MTDRPRYTDAERAFAKLNLSLQVRHRRADGYHELSGIMQRVSLADTVTLTVNRETDSGHSDIAFECRNFSVTGEDNLVVKAARRWLAEQTGGLSITLTLDKHIPVEAGLAGGSTDAAATLRLLQRYAVHHGSGVRPLDDATLLAVATDLGADVPFCLVGDTAFVRGIGDRIEPLALNRPLYFILVKPEAGISTAAAFGELNRSKDPADYPEALGKAFADEIINRHPAARWHEHLFNDFWPVARKLRPELDALYTLLTDIMPTAYVALSGSGPTLFGAFTDKKRRDTAFTVLRAVLAERNDKSSAIYSCSTLID